MRITVEVHNQAAIVQLAEQLGTANLSVAVNYIINAYRLGAQPSAPRAPGSVAKKVDFGLDDRWCSKSV